MAVLCKREKVSKDYCYVALRINAKLQEEGEPEGAWFDLWDHQQDKISQ